MRIGNEIEQLSGPVKISYLEPESTSLPTILLFHDEHYSKLGDCDDSEDGCFRLNDCYHINDPQFLRLFDNYSSPEYPIHFYIEHPLDPEMIQKEHQANNDYISDFLTKFKVCYSKKTLTRDKECPTKHCQWHFVDTRFAFSGNNEDKYLYKGILLIREFLPRFFCEDKKGRFNEFYQFCTHLSSTEKKSLQYVLEWLDGPSFINKYITLDSGFLISKQISKIDDIRYNDYGFWKDILIQSNRNYLIHYLKEEDDIVKQAFHNLLILYRDILRLILTIETVDEPDTLFTNYKEKIIPYDACDRESLYHLYNIYVFVSGSAFLDVYTMSRMLKTPGENENKPYLCCVYVGRHHAEEISKTLIKEFGYTLKGESEGTNSENRRCQNTSKLSFDIQKVLQRYRQKY